MIPHYQNARISFEIICRLCNWDRVGTAGKDSILFPFFRTQSIRLYRIYPRSGRTLHSLKGVVLNLDINDEDPLLFIRLGITMVRM